jgi:hypothetical protein
MTATKKIEEGLEELAQAIRPDDKLVENVMSRIASRPVGGSVRIKKLSAKLIERRFIMNRFTKFAAAAVIIAALSIGLRIFKTNEASAALVLTQASEAMSRLRSVYIKVLVRTRANGHENFDLIDLNYDLVSHEMWKEFDETDIGKWRIENAGRIEVMDGESSLLFISPNQAAIGKHRYGYNNWLKSLLDVDKILDEELRLATEEGSELLLTHEQGTDGRQKLIVTVEAKAQGDFTNDWCKNTSISESDNYRIYQFDAETKLLEGLEVYVHSHDEDVLVLEITDIEFNLDIDPVLFTIEFPDDVIWFKQPEELVDQSYAQMTPKEVAQAFFQACADENWEEAIKFYSASAIPQLIKDYLGGLEVISIGKPFKSGLYPGYFVPYEIKFKNGTTKKMNLAVRNDNSAKQYIVEGGF